ncbi:MAG TPA: PEP-CTERM sorting domain-containing protein [Isosphaeraceae bacterium]|nr:PEP-CTERM sorting domain-containing protein [Isosphaeraceae bacterium]
MRKNSKWTGLSTMVMALGLVAWTASEGKADPLINYNTAGSIGTTGITGSNIISFVPITDGSPNHSDQFTSPSNFSLGYFQVAPLPAGQSTTYDNTPFDVTFLVKNVNGQAPNPNATPIDISGTLKGTVTGSDVSNVTATFNPPTNSTSTGSQVTATPTQITDTFQTGSYSNTMTIPSSGFLIVPSSSNLGQTTLEAHLTSTTSPVPPPAGAGGSGTPTPDTPEPTSIALFAMALGGLALHRYRARRAA